LPDELEQFQKRMSFSATDTPSSTTNDERAAATNNPTIDKIKQFGSRFSSMVTRQTAPTINKFTSQGVRSLFFTTV
jgi:hypothetical protein